MKFARVVFVIAGVWGLLLLTPIYFLFDYIGRQHSVPITYPQFFYGFLAITMAWQFGFLVIGSDPDRYRLMMIPSVIEKFGFVATMAVLYVQLRVDAADMLVVAPDLLWGILFTIAFAKTAPRGQVDDADSSLRAHRQPGAELREHQQDFVRAQR